MVMQSLGQNMIDISSADCSLDIRSSGCSLDISSTECNLCQI